MYCYILLCILPLSTFLLSPSPGLCWFPGPVGFDWYIHAWEDTHTQDIINTNIQSSLVAEDTSAHHWKKIWTILYLLFWRLSLQYGWWEDGWSSTSNLWRLSGAVVSSCKRKRSYMEQYLLQSWRLSFSGIKESSYCKELISKFLCLFVCICEISQLML